MGNVEGNLRERYHNGKLQVSVDNGTTWNDVGAGTSFFDTEAVAHRADVPQLTDSVPIIVGLSNVGETASTGASDALVDGGALTGNGTAFVTLTKGSVIQNPKTTRWAISYQAKIGTVQAAKVSYMGLGTAAGSQLILFASDQSRDGTNFIFFGFNGANTTLENLGAADASTHIVRATNDTTSLKIYVDNVLKQTMVLASEPNFPTVPMFPIFHATAGFSGQAVWNCLYSFARV